MSRLVHIPLKKQKNMIENCKTEEDYMNIYKIIYEIPEHHLFLDLRHSVMGNECVVVVVTVLIVPVRSGDGRENDVGGSGGSSTPAYERYELLSH